MWWRRPRRLPAGRVETRQIGRRGRIGQVTRDLERGRLGNRRLGKWMGMERRILDTWATGTSKESFGRIRRASGFELWVMRASGVNKCKIMQLKFNLLHHWNNEQAAAMAGPCGRCTLALIHIDKGRWQPRGT